MKSLLDPTFRYTSSANTDLRKTFARIRRELAKQQKLAAPTEEQPAPPKVSPLFKAQR